MKRITIGIFIFGIAVGYLAGLIHSAKAKEHRIELERRYAMEENTMPNPPDVHPSDTRTAFRKTPCPEQL